MSRFHRLKQVTQFGWKHAGQISRDSFSGKKRVPVLIDILKCYLKYGMWSNQYLKERFWELDKNQRSLIGVRYQSENQKREAWVKDFYENRDFFIKYGNVKYEKESLREKRKNAYIRHFNTGSGLSVEYDVNISRQHYLNGTITIGDNVLLSKHIFIDYSGEVVIGNKVKLSDGVTIESHRHEFVPGSKEYKPIPTKIVIQDGAWIGQKAVICEDCKCIGRYAQIGAGSIVRNQIPPYAIVAGNPAKIVGFLFTPEEVEQFEQDKYPDKEHTDLERYKKLYEKYFINRISEIKKMLNN